MPLLAIASLPARPEALVGRAEQPRFARVILNSVPSANSNTEPTRCNWAPWPSDLMLRYHDEEWGVPSHDDRHLFEMLILEGAQAGLSWTTILNKRENYRRAFDGFDFEKIARYGEDDVARLLGDAGIVRNRMKIEAAIGNAKALLAVREEF